MPSIQVAGLVVVMALLGPGSAQAQGVCTELTLYGDLGTTAGCGDTRTDGTLLVEDLNGIPGLDCPGSNCSGDSYTFADWSDLIRVVLAGMHHDDADNLGMQDCNSDVRWSIVDTWQNLFEGSCTDATCEQAQHLWRLPDDDPGTDTFLELLGLPPIEAEPFCNGYELEDNDPIRRPCAEGEDVCQPSGTLGLVLPIVPGPGSNEPCSLGVFRWKILPFTRFDCPQGINPLFGLCLQPQDAQGNFGCLNPAFNTSFGTPAGVDGRVHNLWPLNADGTAPIVNGKELVAAFDRIHTGNTIAPGADVCLEPAPSDRIECLTEASPCSLGTECKDESPRFACSEQGIRDAIAAGGGPHRFACAGPTTVTTTSQITIDNDVILDGEGNLTVDGNDDHGVFYVDSETVTVELRGFVITGGRDSGIANFGTLAITDSTVTGNASGIGGGIANDGVLTVTNSLVTGNRADDAGGGIFNSRDATVVGTEVSGNEAGPFGGGGIFNYSESPSFLATLAVVDSIVSGNSTNTGGVPDEVPPFGGGGGIYNQGSLSVTSSTVSGNSATAEAGSGDAAGGGIRHVIGDATVTESIVSGNDAAFVGGGISCGFTDASGLATCELEDTEVSGNDAGFDGGGISNDSATLTLNNSLVSGNNATFAAGGIMNGSAFVASSGALIILDSEVSGNQAALIGGLANVSNSTLALVNSTVSGNRATGTESDTGGIFNSGTAELTNSTVSGNSATGSGGGITNELSGTLTLTHTTVSRNTAGLEGAALYNEQAFSAPTVTNSIIEGDCVNLFGPVTSGGHNVESPGNTCGFTGTGDQTTVPRDGPSGLNLGPLQDNDGPTFTQAPVAPSAAINQILLAACAITTDQRGEPRPETGGSMCDIGAVEVQPPP